ncbi:MAG: prepilin-type N-terminal cleavage/methylation domain-containing protein [Deltaproteobacteria bacterium]|nr:prepilin-type N-terminal cleavage/methylation domain-containing protein [Deltaproteobacteria bacterium]
MQNKGFSLIELIMVMALVAIVAAVVVPLIFRGGSTMTAAAMARKVKADIQYAQELAMAKNNMAQVWTGAAWCPAQPQNYRIRMNFAANQYEIYNDQDGDGIWGEDSNACTVSEDVRNPSSGEVFFLIQLTGAGNPYTGITLNANFGGATPGVLEFDALGIPYDSDGNRLTADKTITIAKDGETAQITVTQNTGRVQ